MTTRIFRRREAERQDQQQKMFAVTLVLMLALGIGAALVLLLASRGNHNIRAEVADNIEEAIHSLEKEMTDLRKRLEDRAS